MLSSNTKIIENNNNNENSYNNNNNNKTNIINNCTGYCNRNNKKVNDNNDNNDSYSSNNKSKGEKVLLTSLKPLIEKELPQCLRQRHNLVFDTEKYNLYEEVVTLLTQTSYLGKFKNNDIPKLEEFYPFSDIFRNFKSRQSLYQAVNKNTSLLSIYEKLVVDICCPFLKDVYSLNHPGI